MIFLNYPGHLLASLLLGTIAVLVIITSRFKSMRKVKLWTIPLALLQFLALLILVMILWNPSIPEMTESTSKNSVLLLFDTSRSMSVVDWGSNSRLDNAIDVFQKEFNSNDPQSPIYQIYGFDQDYYYAGSVESLRRWGQATDLKSAFKLLSKFSGSDSNKKTSGATHFGQGKVAGAVIFTDGQADDKYLASYPSAANIDFPVAVVGIGSTSAQYDLAVKSIKSPLKVALNTSFTTEVIVNASNAGGESATIELLKDGNVISSKHIAAKDISDVTTIKFNIGADQTGSHSLMARIKSERNETNSANNTQATLFEVVDDRKIKVLFYSQVASFDVGKICQSLSQDKKVQLDLKMDVVIPAVFNEGSSQVKLPADRDGFYEYDVIILGPCMADALTDSQIDGLYSFVAYRGGGLILLPGYSEMGPVGWKNEKIRSLVPVFTTDKVSSQIYGMNKIELTADGMNSGVIDPTYLADFEPSGILFYNNIIKKPASTTLASVNQHPAVIVHRLGRGRVCMLNISRLFHWYREDLNGGFLRVFISGLTEYAARITKSESPIEFFAEHTAGRKDSIKFDVYLKDNNSEPIDGANVLLHIGNDILRAEKTGHGHYSLETGEYSGQSVLATVRAELHGLFLGEKSIVVNQPPVRGEMDTTGLDGKFLQSLADRIDADYFHIYYMDNDTLEMFECNTSVKNLSAMVNVWPKWWLLAILCLILSAQWFIRRAIGLV